MSNPGDTRTGAESLQSWLLGRSPEVPEPFLPHLLPSEAMPVRGPENLAELGGRAIQEALSLPGRDRRAAFQLLAGDALLTYACEAAAEVAEPGPFLEGLLKRLGDRFR